MSLTHATRFGFSSVLALGPGRVSCGARVGAGRARPEPWESHLHGELRLPQHLYVPRDPSG